MMRRDVSKGLRKSATVDLHEPLRATTWEQMKRIDDALAEVGPFGEVWLIKREGVVQTLRKLDTVNAALAAFR